MRLSHDKLGHQLSRAGSRGCTDFEAGRLADSNGETCYALLCISVRDTAGEVSLQRNTSLDLVIANEFDEHIAAQ